MAAGYGWGFGGWGFGGQLSGGEGGWLRQRVAECNNC